MQKLEVKHEDERSLQRRALSSFACGLLVTLVVFVLVLAAIDVERDIQEALQIINSHL